MGDLPNWLSQGLIVELLTELIVAVLTVLAVLFRGKLRRAVALLFKKKPVVPVAYIVVPVAYITGALRGAIQKNLRVGGGRAPQQKKAGGVSELKLTLTTA
jgi:hypothetical protein